MGGKKKKKLAVILCLCLFALLALGSGTSKSSSSGSTKSVSDVKKGSDTTTPTIAEQVLADQNDITITAKEYTSDTIRGDGIKLLIENNSDKDITVGCSALIVNDYMISDLFVADVGAGTKSNETMYLSSSALKAAGISSVGQVEIYFHVYEKGSIKTIFDSDDVVIKTSAYDQMDTSAQDSGQELYNANGVRIVGKAVDEKSFWGSAILLYVENTSGKNIGIRCSQMTINGYSVTAYLSSEVYDQRKAIDDISISSSDLKKNDITSIDDVSLKFEIYTLSDHKTIATTDMISFSAK